ncbi:MAG: antibiotic biosynthesis monooxygenase [Kiritimatiellae bacterium]|nr:antibiotic biosynthesis monooxygenase [Kiritimatiellia bacterium]
MIPLALSLAGFAALFAAIWLLHRPLDVHACPVKSARVAHRVLEWALVAWAAALLVQAGHRALTAGSTGDGRLVRIAEIEVRPEWLDAYLAAARTVGAESVAKEDGVVCIFPMQLQESPATLRIVEIYRDEAAYRAHLETPHVRAYKEGTAHMVKSLALVPMKPLDAAHMNLIFRKDQP